MKLPRSITTLLAFSLLFATTAPVAALADSRGMELFLNQSDLSWGPAPAGLPTGAKVSVLLGDPGKPGHFVLRLMTPANYKIPPHFHSQAEALTVISGALYLGDGEKWDTGKAHALQVGGFHYLPARASHFAFTETPTIVEIHGDGPFDIIYIHSEDDPRKTPVR
jgi:hypothetical protein